MSPSDPIPVERQILTPAGGPPEVDRPSPEIFTGMGEDGIRRMIDDFYQALERSPIRPMFAADMHAAASRSADYFIQLLGGPPLYLERHGPPRLRARHLPFRIDDNARRIWIGCFDDILANAANYNFPLQHLPGFRAFLEAFSHWMVNTR